MYPFSRLQFIVTANVAIFVRKNRFFLENTGCQPCSGYIDIRPHRSLSTEEHSLTVIHLVQINPCCQSKRFPVQVHTTCIDKSLFFVFLKTLSVFAVDNLGFTLNRQHFSGNLIFDFFICRSFESYISQRVLQCQSDSSRNNQLLLCFSTDFHTECTGTRECVFNFDTLTSSSIQTQRL